MAFHRQRKAENKQQFNNSSLKKPYSWELCIVWALAKKKKASESILFFPLCWHIKSQKGWMQVKIWPATACPFFWCPIVWFSCMNFLPRAKEGPLPTFFTCSSIFFTWKHGNEKLLSKRNECQLMSPWEKGFCEVKFLNKPENKRLDWNRHRR